MKKLTLALTLALAPSFALAQSMPTWKSYMATGNTADIVPSAGTSDSVAAWLAKKVDVTSGSSTNQTLTTPTITGGSSTNQTLTTPTITDGTVTGTDVSAAYTKAAGIGTGVSQTSQTISNYLGGASILPGCVGDGKTDDTACVQAAITAHAGGTLYLGTGLYLISSGFTLASQIKIVGSGGGQSIYHPTCTAGFVVSGDATAFSLTGKASQQSVIEDTCLQYSGLPTSGSAVSIGEQADNVSINRVTIYGAHTGIAVSGSGASQSLGARITYNTIVPESVSGASAISIGASSTYANTGDNLVEGNQIFCGATPSDTNADGINIYDDGGSTYTKNDIYACRVGTYIAPGVDQEITWEYFLGTVLGDTSEYQGFLATTTDASAQIKGLSFVQSWASNSQSTSTPTLEVNNASGGMVDTLHFVGHRSMLAAGVDGIKVTGGSNVSIDSSTVCATAASTATGIRFGGNATAYTVHDSTIGGCANNVSATLDTGVAVTSSANPIASITGNTFISDLTSAVSWSPTYATSAGDAVISNNVGIDGSIPTIAQTATTTLPVNPTVIFSENTAVSTMSGMWNGRKVEIIPTSGSGMSFASGGNICSGSDLTLGQNQIATAIYNGGASCWIINPGVSH